MYQGTLPHFCLFYHSLPEVGQEILILIKLLSRMSFKSGVLFLRHVMFIFVILGSERRPSIFY